MRKKMIKKLIPTLLALTLAASSLTVSAATKSKSADTEVEEETEEETEEIKCEHLDTEETARLEPTCTQDGIAEGVYCNDCNTFIEGGETIPAIGHIDEDGDGICDDCEAQFEAREAEEATCTESGYSGDEEVDGRLVIGYIIPATGHTDTNKDYICDVCGEAVTKKNIKIKLHYYITQEEYEENKEKYSASNFKVKESENVKGCYYVLEIRTEKQNTEFSVPEAPKMKKYSFTWIDADGAVYTTFKFNKSTDLYMAYAENSKDVAEGQCGDTAYWRWFPEEKVLYFYGHGELWNDYDTKADLPWYEYLSQRDHVLMANNITAELWLVTEDY